MWSVQEQTVQGKDVEVSLTRHADDSNTCYLNVHGKGFSTMFVFQNEGGLLKVVERDLTAQPEAPANEGTASDPVPGSGNAAAGAGIPEPSTPAVADATHLS